MRYIALERKDKLAKQRDASIAQLVERDLAKVEVTSSNLVTRSKSFIRFGGMAEWPCSGLQIRLPRFDSGFRLHFITPHAKAARCPGGGIGRHKGFKIPRQ